ncbi:hypothetical protein Pcinc_041468 [Petrolisthes cinctipes]|uniref:Uncharacterized protein n=1 Tax=Petrolisthes cinctipes TaxID=88211 RepID=A0AAE1BK40_PETCI|nr:hypothetical protein Pcinc_041468 [Petrolisthes cinctipes]
MILTTRHYTFRTHLRQPTSNPPPTFSPIFVRSFGHHFTKIVLRHKFTTGKSVITIVFRKNMEGLNTIEAVQGVIHDDGVVEGDVPPVYDVEDMRTEMGDVTTEVRKERQRNSRWRRFLRKFMYCCCCKPRHQTRFREPLCDSDPWFGSTPNYFKKMGKAVTFQNKPKPTPVTRVWKETLANQTPDYLVLPSL